LIYLFGSILDELSNSRSDHALDASFSKSLQLISPTHRRYASTNAQIAALYPSCGMRTVIVDEAVGEGGRGAPWVRIRFERVTAAAEERQLSQNTLLKALTLEALPSDRAGEFYEEAKPKKGGKQ
jgi:hypothetical protein